LFVLCIKEYYFSYIFLTFFLFLLKKDIILQKKVNGERKSSHYDVNEVIDRFDIDKIFDCQILKNWLTNLNDELKPSHAEILEEARLQLVRKWDEWNEEELKIHFIGFVLFCAQLEEPKFISTYFERKLSGKVKGIPITVVVDCMVATPKKSGRPKMPYFFMQEFKRSKGDTHDPEGQMLAAMILAQELNNNQQTLYGSWVQGVHWRFTVLHGSEYCVSRTFDASDKVDLLRIVFILRKLKGMILNITTI
jgi:hypothetical protein